MRQTVCVIVATVTALGLFTVSFARDGYDRYRIQADVDVNQKIISAHQTVRLTNRGDSAFQSVYFHIYPNRKYTPGEIRELFHYAGYFKVDPYPEGFAQGRLDIAYIKYNGQPLRFEIRGTDQSLLEVFLPHVVLPGEPLTLDMEFEADIPHAYGRFGWHQGIIKSAYWYPVLAAQTEGGWNTNEFYPFHRPFFSDAALYEVDLRVPAESVVIHSGYEKNKTSQGDRTIYHIDTDFPIRAFSFSMSRDYQVARSTRGPTTLQCFFLPGDEARAGQALENLQDVFAFYENIFGPYPYKQFSVAPVHLGYGGEQMANMIFIDTRVFKLPGLLDREFDLLIAHETGHQWLYNMIGSDNNHELWMEEGLNSYFILRYLENKYGQEAGVLEYPSWIKPYAWMFPEVKFNRLRDYRYQLEARMGYDGALIAPLEMFRDPSRIFSLIYGKGVDAAEAIRARIGDEAFANVFKKAYARYRFGNWAVRDFMRLCEEESGEDLKEFFEQRLFSDGQCDYAVFARGKTVSLRRIGDIIEPVEVEVAFTNGRKERFVWDGKAARFEKDFSEKIQSAEVDPEEKIFDIDRINNMWPRQWSIMPVPLYFGLYDNPLFLPDDRYNVVVGPEFNDGIGIKASLQRPYEHILYGGVDYEWNDHIWRSRAGVLKKNIMRSPLSAGAEILNVTDQGGGQEDLLSGKIYLRRDFDAWPYGLFDLQNHASLYFVRNRRPNGLGENFSNAEDERSLEYRRDEEAIVGVSYYLNRSGPYPDPKHGFKMAAGAETAGHMLGGEYYFYRSSMDMTMYMPVTARTKLASRIKAGFGYPDDKDLFQLGGLDGLRGYGRKTIRGANAVLGVAEYRFPLVSGLNWYVGDRIFGLTGIDAGVFFEAGRSWFSSFRAKEWKTDAGLSLRFHVNVAGFLEKLIIRLDAAQAINDSGEEPRFWLSVNQPF